MQHRTSRGLVGRRSHARGTSVGHDYASGTNHLGRTHDGTKVALVGHVVEQYHERVALARRRYDVGKVRILKRLHLEHDALMCAMGRTAVQSVASHVLNRNVSFLEPSNKVVQRPVPLTRAGDHQRPTQGNARIERLCRRAAPLNEIRMGRCLTNLLVLARRRRYVALATRILFVWLGLRIWLARALARATTHVAPRLARLVLSHVGPSLCPPALVPFGHFVHLR